MSGATVSLASSRTRSKRAALLVMVVLVCALLYGSETVTFQRMGLKMADAVDESHAIGNVTGGCPIPSTEHAVDTVSPSADPSSYQRPPSDSAMRQQREVVMQYMRSPAFKERVAGMAQQDPRGILINAGGRMLLTNLVVLLKVLRGHHGCKLPVEVVWHQESEMDNGTLAALDREFGPVHGRYVHALPYPSHHRRVEGGFKGWPAKVYALLHCRFREVLVLDADSMPLFDPEQLFREPDYMAYGNLFWPDAWANWVKRGAYQLMGLDPGAAKAALDAGRGFVLRDCEAGQFLIDRARHADVLEMLVWGNSFADKLYRHLHGDKDSFPLAFAAAGKAHMYRQVSVPPGGAFKWSQNVLEHKGSDRRSDGWQMLGFVQYRPGGAPAFMHRTMNKWSLDRDNWPVQLLTGPIPMRWARYYLAHDSLGSTKGVWWEHAAPDSAFTKLTLNPPWQLATRGGEQMTCDVMRLSEILKFRQCGLPVERDVVLEERCQPMLPQLLGTRNGSRACVALLLEGLNQQLLTRQHLEEVQLPTPGNQELLGAPIPTLVMPGADEAGSASYTIAAIQKSYEAMAWLRDNVGMFPAIHEGT